MALANSACCPFTRRLLGKLPQCGAPARAFTRSNLEGRNNNEAVRKSGRKFGPAQSASADRTSHDASVNLPAAKARLVLAMPWS